MDGPAHSVQEAMQHIRSFTDTVEKLQAATAQRFSRNPVPPTMANTTTTTTTTTNQATASPAMHRLDSLMDAMNPFLHQDHLSSSTSSSAAASAHGGEDGAQTRDPPSQQTTSPSTSHAKPTLLASATAAKDDRAMKLSDLMRVRYHITAQSSFILETCADAILINEKGNLIGPRRHSERGRGQVQATKSPPPPARAHVSGGHHILQDSNNNDSNGNKDRR